MSHDTVYIYADEGVCLRSLRATYDAFAWATHYRISYLTAKHVVQKSWMRRACCFVMPGGADLPYARQLNGGGNRCIREYVHLGGTYIGLCAGAYYGCRICDFHRGDLRPGYAVYGVRELSFFQGAAVGPTLAPYVYDTLYGARVAEVQCHIAGQKELCYAYYNGGCHFPHAQEHSDVCVLAYYSGCQRRLPMYVGDLPAIIMCRFGAGRAILSGVHPEYRYNHLLPQRLSGGRSYSDGLIFDEALHFMQTRLDDTLWALVLKHGQLEVLQA